jgi:hypothetical protein
MYPNDDSIINFHSEKLNAIRSGKVQPRTQYQFSMKPESSNDIIYRNGRDAHFSTSNAKSKKINYSEYTSNMMHKKAPKNKYHNILPTRGSYNMNKSIEMNLNRNILFADRLHQDDVQSFRDQRTSIPEPFRPIKTMKSVSKDPSLRKMRPSKSEFNMSDKRYYGNEKYSEVVRDGKSYPNWLDHSENSANKDTPNKPVDGKHHTESHKLPSTYIDLYRYRSSSFQNNLETRNDRSQHKIAIKSSLLRDRRSDNYHSKYSKRRDSINYAERVNARKAMRSKEFEKLYQESTEGNLKSPPIHELNNSNGLNMNTSYDKNRKSLAEQIQKHSTLKNKHSYQNLESLNSSRNNREPNKPRTGPLGEKDIPDEGEARRPDLHKTKINDFHGTGRKTKNIIKDQVFIMASGKKLKFNDSFEITPNFRAPGSDFKYKYRPQSKENLRFKKKQVDEQEDSDSKWSLWNTLKNPLQWLGISKEADNTPIKVHGKSAPGRKKAVSHYMHNMPSNKLVRAVPSQRVKF